MSDPKIENAALACKTKRWVLRRAAMVLTGLACGGHLQAGTLWVSPDGSDKSPGTEEKPFATLERARDAGRALREKAPGAEITVTLKGGVYRLSQTLVFSMADSAPQGRTVFQAAPGEKPVLSSAHPITGWKKAQTLPEGFPAVAQGKVWVAKVPEHPGKGGVWTFKTLYAGDKRLPRARGPGFAPTRRSDKEGWNGRRCYTENDILDFPEGTIKQWPNLQDVEIYVIPGAMWIANYLPLKSVDLTAKRAITTVPATYEMTGIEIKKRTLCIRESVWVENVPEALDEPGEWVLNTTDRKVYFWPEDEEQLKSVCAPALTELVRVEGKIDHDGPADEPVRNITFKGLTFTEGDRYTWTPQSRSAGHDWETYDAANALLRFRGAQGCVVDGCEFKRTGESAVRFDLYAQENAVQNSKFSDIGLTGILLFGYGPGTKDVNHHNRVVNNYITRCGQVTWHGFGILIMQSGHNQILNNRIHEMPYDGIGIAGPRCREWAATITEPKIWSGGFVPPKDRREWQSIIRWNEVGTPTNYWDVMPFIHSRHNLIQDNEVHDCVLRLGDGNCYYLTATGVGNIVRRNLAYNVGYGQCFRCDENQYDTLLEENIAIGELGFAIRNVNSAINNIAYSPNGESCVGMGGGQFPFDAKMVTELGMSPRIERNIVVALNAQGLGIRRELLRGGNSVFKVPSRNNLLFSSNPGTLEANEQKLVAMQAKGLDQGSMVADPLFVSPEKFDFRFMPESPASKLGIKEVDVARIGLLEDPAFERLRKEGMPKARKGFWREKPDAWYLPGTNPNAYTKKLKPNVVVILADDLGYGDVRCYNPQRGKIPTPNIDRLASEGMRFTDGHSSSGLCTPSRYSLLTGRYHWRSRCQWGIVGTFAPPLITSNRFTIANLAKSQGYRTAAVGKWHLGWNWPIEPAERQFFATPVVRAWLENETVNRETAPPVTPEQQNAWKAVFSRAIPGGPTSNGFDTYFGVDIPNFPPYCFIENDRTVGIPSQFLPIQFFDHGLCNNQGPALPDWKLEKILPSLADRATKLVAEAAQSRTPYLLYLSLTSPHSPLAVNLEWQGKSGLSSAYADFVMETDAVVGRVLDAIEKTGQANRTLVVFTSDNGCSPNIGNVGPLQAKGHFPSGPLRGYKGDAWEGGHRIPFLVRWPDVVKPGTVCGQLAQQSDIMATIADILGVKLPDNAGEDSVSLLPLLKGDDRPVRNNAVNCSAQGVPAIRDGSWKLLLAPGSGGWSKGGESDQPVQLYNLADDLGETKNLAAAMPGKVTEMKALLDKIITDGRSTPGAKQQNDVKVVRHPRAATPKKHDHD